MDDIGRITECIKQLQIQLEKYAGIPLKETQTRLTFINPLLIALGWDVADPEQVDNEHGTVDGKAVDYALKVSGKVVFLVEAKPLGDPLTDVKAITQVVGYASNEGIEWCALTNGATYRIYCSTEKELAPDKLLFEVSIDPRNSEYTSLEEVAGQLRQISREAMESGRLEEILTRSKVRKALDKLFVDPSAKLVGMVKAAAGDESIKSVQVKEAIKELWSQHGTMSSPHQLKARWGAQVSKNPESTQAEDTLHIRVMRHPPVKSSDGTILAPSPHAFAHNHKPPLKYKGMRCAIDSLTASQSPEGYAHGFHYDIDYRQDGVYVERKQGAGYRTSPEKQGGMRRKAGL